MVLVGHGITSELHSMEQLGIDLSGDKKVGSVVAVIDTLAVSQYLIRYGGMRRSPTTDSARLTLDSSWVSISLHDGGNDALKALLMLTVLGLRGARSCNLHAERIPNLQSIAQASTSEHLSGLTLDR